MFKRLIAIAIFCWFPSIAWCQMPPPPPPAPTGNACRQVQEYWPAPPPACAAVATCEVNPPRHYRVIERLRARRYARRNYHG